MRMAVRTLGLAHARMPPTACMRWPHGAHASPMLPAARRAAWFRCHVRPAHSPHPQIATTADLPVGRKSAVVVGGSAGPGPEKPFSQLHMDYWGKLHRAGWLLYGWGRFACR